MQIRLRRTDVVENVKDSLKINRDKDHFGPLFGHPLLHLELLKPIQDEKEEEEEIVIIRRMSHVYVHFCTFSKTIITARSETSEKINFFIAPRNRKGKLWPAQFQCAGSFSERTCCHQ